jgi:hypothetical protein
MNFCKNCKHYTHSYGHANTERCTKYILHTDVVKGKSTYRSCHEARFLSNLCGHEGKDFDPKPTLIQRIKLYLAPTTK